MATEKQNNLKNDKKYPEFSIYVIILKFKYNDSTRNSHKCCQ